MNTLFNFFLVSLVFLFNIKSANAYLDPGTGSLIFQVIVGTLLGGMLTIKTYYHKLKKIGSSKRKDKNRDINE